jgi:uncharacterized protein (DUF1499 family)
MSQLAKNNIHDHKSLSPCGSGNNCVSSLNFDDINYVEPITYSGRRTDAREALIAIINSLNPRGTVVSSENHIQAQFVSTMFGFTDDVDFMIDKRNKKIQLRSSSRVGFYDWGVNRKRIETIRGMFNTVQKKIHDLTP